MPEPHVESRRGAELFGIAHHRDPLADISLSDVDRKPMLAARTQRRRQHDDGDDEQPRTAHDECHDNRKGRHPDGDRPPDHRRGE